MNEYLSGKCAHCGERKEEHCGPFINCAFLYNKHGIFESKTFFDSGLKLLHDRAPELLQAAREVVRLDKMPFEGDKVQNTWRRQTEAMKALESIIGDILRPQP